MCVTHDDSLNQTKNVGLPATFPKAPFAFFLLGSSPKRYNKADGI